jgi:uncharacterized protein YfaP (DUF2135 family)
MSYPSVDAPYGLVAINSVDGKPYAGATRQLPIASTYNTAIFNGDIVAVVAGGTIALSGVTDDSTTSAANYTYGVFVGVQYVNSQGQTVQAQYYPGNAAATSAIAYVVDDPMAAFKVAVVNSSSVVQTVNRSIVGVNMAIDQGTGSTITGNSGAGVLVATNALGNAATLPVRVVSVVPETATGTNAFTEVVVKLNNPQILRQTGLNYVA